MKTTNISLLSKLLLIACSVLLLVSAFVPIWRIELNAPQYPEGLKLLIYANHLGGDFDIINGLNHYIGMKTLHTADFFEFSILRYLIFFFASISLLVALFGKKKFLYVLFILFCAFGVIAMADFWRWEYNYGHNLNPNAAIIVPGMAYQPPLIGYKQLLNFGAYSIPDLGGWLFLMSGILMLFSTLKEMNFMKWFGKTQLMSVIFLCFLVSCATDTPDPIQINKDSCDFCKMTIANPHFSAEFKTKKGRAYKFDDLNCMLHYLNEHRNTEIASYYISDFVSGKVMMNATQAIYLHSELFATPMGGNYAAFKSNEEAESYIQKYKATKITWETLPR